MIFIFMFDSICLNKIGMNAVCSLIIEHDFLMTMRKNIVERRIKEHVVNKKISQLFKTPEMPFLVGQVR